MHEILNHPDKSPFNTDYWRASHSQFHALFFLQPTSEITCWCSVSPLSVIATMRDLKKKDKLIEAAGDTYGKTLMLLPLDVCSDESVKQCINNVKDRHIDILSE